MNELINELETIYYSLLFLSLSLYL